MTTKYLLSQSLTTVYLQTTHLKQTGIE